MKSGSNNPMERGSAAQSVRPKAKRCVTEYATFSTIQNGDKFSKIQNTNKFLLLSKLINIKLNKKTLNLQEKISKCPKTHSEAPYKCLY